jgi:hypothetical protein
VDEDLQRLLYRFKTTSEEYNMKLSIEKTKTMVISKNPTQCKLSIDGKTIEETMTFKYLGVEMSADKNLTQELGN